MLGKRLTKDAPVPERNNRLEASEQVLIVHGAAGAAQVALYVSMGAGGYYLFGTSVSSDILVSFPLDDPSIIVGRVAVSFVAAVSATAR